MRTVNEVSRLTGVSIRTLQYYDKIGLLCPALRTPAGYRLYDDAALERLQQILLFRELEFPLKEIAAILKRPDFDRAKALEQQITLLTLKKQHLEALIAFARGIKQTGDVPMDFTAFDTSKLDEYAQQAKQQWGGTPAYAEYEQKAAQRTKETELALGAGMMLIFEELGKLKAQPPTDAAAQALVQKLQAYITEHYYACTPEILAGLGQMYVGDERFTASLDAAGGTGTAQFTAAAIAAYCKL